MIYGGHANTKRTLLMRMTHSFLPEALSSVNTTKGIFRLDLLTVIHRT
jgi:hypothetical protein